MLGKLLKALFGQTATGVSSRAAREREAAALAAAHRAADIEARGKDAIARRHADNLRAVLAECDEHDVSTYGWSKEAHTSELPALFDLEQRIDREADTWPHDAVFHEESAGTKKSGAGDGRFQVTPSGYIYEGDARRELAWADVYHLACGSEDYGRDDTVWYLAIQQRGRQTSTKYWFDMPAPAQRAYLVATAFVARARVAAPTPPAPSLPRQQRTVVPTPPVAGEAVAVRADDEEPDFETDIVGESFDGRQESLQAIVARVADADAAAGVRFVATLVPEPTNRYDPQAVAVHDRVTGARLGYLARQLAALYQAAVTAASARGPVEVPGVVRGVDRFGVWIDLTQFNASVGLPPPEQLSGANDTTYFERRQAAGLVDGITWITHLTHATEASALGAARGRGGGVREGDAGMAGRLSVRRPPTRLCAAVRGLRPLVPESEARRRRGVSPGPLCQRRRVARTDVDTVCAVDQASLGPAGRGRRRGAVLMPHARNVSLTHAEIATIRRSLLTVEDQIDALRDGRPTAPVMRRLQEAVAGVRFLLERAEARRDVH